ncbi:hypothetical protein [Desulfogranum japonicum]|uniref:hypothetical protein n=1 Tax=Desulfogranum japonicum TaxID=231447 RepID=UPI00048FAD02|nr:hypothetical protein [Desulfogranum japonicum]
MANILGFTKNSQDRLSAEHVFLIGIVAVSLAGFMLFSDDRWADHLLSMVGTIAVILLLIGFGLSRMHPMLWKRIFHKAEYGRYVKGQREIVEALQNLGDEYQVLCGFTFELIHIEFLVLCPGNIFVLGQANTQAPLRVEDDLLMAGNQSLQKLTANLWKASHLVNLVFKKGYGRDLMPMPILVIPHGQEQGVEEFDGITIVHPEQLGALLDRSRQQDISEEMVLGFSEYLYKRYMA